MRLLVNVRVAATVAVGNVVAEGVALRLLELFVAERRVVLLGEGVIGLEDGDDDFDDATLAECKGERVMEALSLFLVREGTGVVLPLSDKENNSDGVLEILTTVTALVDDRVSVALVNAVTLNSGLSVWEDMCDGVGVSLKVSLLVSAVAVTKVVNEGDRDAESDADDELLIVCALVTVLILDSDGELVKLTSTVSVSVEVAVVVLLRLEELVAERTEMDLLDV